MVATTNTHFQTAIERCFACATACEGCVNACLSDDTSEQGVASIRKALDCSTICQATAALLGRGSGIATDLCRVCIEACLRCEAEVSRHKQEACKACAKACSECEDALRAIS